ncbi:MAG: hypothetical protein PHG89_07990 [Gallionella sp.]|nr:hypothetical protein [Gallionella sp.]
MIKPKNMYGKQVRGIERGAFVFGKNGNCAVNVAASRQIDARSKCWISSKP